MKEITVCAKCGTTNIDYLGKDKCFCHECKKKTDTIDKMVLSPQERVRAAVYSTGNKWAIENFEATHN